MYPNEFKIFAALTEDNSCACPNASLVVCPSKDVPSFHPTESNVALLRSLNTSTAFIFVVESCPCNP